MPATARTTTTLSRTALTALAASPGTACDPANGDAYPNSDDSFLLANNTGATNRTVNIAYVSTVDGQTVSARQFTITANTMQLVKLGRTDLYGTTVVLTGAHAELKLQVYSL